MKRRPDPYLRRYRELKHEHPELEHFELWQEAGLQIPSTKGVPWDDGRASPKPAFTRNDPRKFPS